MTNTMQVETDDDQPVEETVAARRAKAILARDAECEDFYLGKTSAPPQECAAGGCDRQVVTGTTLCGFCGYLANGRATR